MKRTPPTVTIAAILSVSGPALVGADPIAPPDDRAAEAAAIPWLSIRARDGGWHWAEGRIDGSDLVVSCKAVKEPVAVRYAYTQHPVGCYLYNKDGLPASPFPTERAEE